MDGKRLCGLRGAIFCVNDSADIELRVAQLFDALLRNNGLEEDDIVSLTFSVTPDINVRNPAAALRKSGRGEALALFSVQESFAVGGPTGVIRVLIHCYAKEGRELRHVYLNGAEVLRPDRNDKNSRPA